MAGMRNLRNDSLVPPFPQEKARRLCSAPMFLFKRMISLVSCFFFLQNAHSPHARVPRRSASLPAYLVELHPSFPKTNQDLGPAARLSPVWLATRLSPKRRLLQLALGAGKKDGQA